VSAVFYSRLKRFRERARAKSHIFCDAVGYVRADVLQHFFNDVFSLSFLRVGEMDIILVVFTAAFFLLAFVMVQGFIRGLSHVLLRRRHLNNF
jgi:hypothetical protein